MNKTKLILNATRGDCLCVGVVADRRFHRIRGFGGREQLPAGEGVLLTPARTVQTYFMDGSIDAVFLDGGLRVLDIVERLRPWRMASCRRARAVLELSAGECARRGVAVGDRLELRDRKPIDVGLFGDNAGAGASEWSTAVVRRMGGGEVARLHPLAVLVMSHDHHFLNVMSLLLARRNCSVTTTANATRAGELVSRKGVNVVVVDVTRFTASSVLGPLETLEPPVGVVLVADDARAGRTYPVTLSKWGPFEDVFEAIERAGQRSRIRVEH